MLKITAEEVNFVVYQFLHESGFQHSAFTFAQEANLHDNKFTNYKVPSGLMVLFLEKALTLIHMETHLNDNEELRICKVPFQLLQPHNCDVFVEQTETHQLDAEVETIMNQEAAHQNKFIQAQNSLPNQVMTSHSNPEGHLHPVQNPQQSLSNPNFMPLASNGSSISVINEHKGDIFFSKWNPSKKILATGGAGDCFVDVWDFNRINPQAIAKLPGSTQSPWMQLRHISVANESQVPQRADDNHFISSIQWSNNGERLLTSAYDNISRVWSMQGKLEGLFRSQNSLICSCWNKSDTLVASGGDDTNILIWNPNTIQKDPLYTFTQSGQIMDIAWQNDRQLAAASGNNIFLWSIDLPSIQKQVWQGHQSCIESIKWDQKGHLLASSATDDSQVLIWSPKSRQHILSLNDHNGPVRDFKWSNVDLNTSTQNQGGVGFIVTLCQDQRIRLYDIARNKAECLMTLKHDNFVGSLSLSPDNSLLAVGGQNQDIYIWSLKDQQLVKTFYNPSSQVTETQNEQDAHSKAIFDINWSFDGAVCAAGFGKSVVMVDVRKIMAAPGTSGEMPKPQHNVQNGSQLKSKEDKRM